MFYASQGLRHAARKGSNTLVHHGGHNGAGGSTTATSSRSIHALHPGRNALNALHAPHPPCGQQFTLAQIRPRNPAHQLFSTSKNLLQRFFTHLTAPGLRAPTYLSDLAGAGTRSLHSSRASIQNGFSLPVRNSLKNHALHRQANTFLPRGPRPAPPRCGGVAEVGLGAARNFSTGRPIFQNLVENVPVALRAFYQVDMDVDSKKQVSHLRAMKVKARKDARRATRQALKPINKDKRLADAIKSTEESTKVTAEEVNHYFPIEAVAPVTTYLLIPLAPTPTGRIPLPRGVSSSDNPSLLPPLSHVGAIHASHSTHALRVSTLFHRLDQANVWERGGVQCSAYSQGNRYRQPRNIVKDDEDDDLDAEGICTVLKVEFVGWTKAQVRAVIGEAGTGWCVLEEVGPEDEVLSSPATGTPLSVSSDSLLGDEDNMGFGDAFSGTHSPNGSTLPGSIDDSLIMPTLDFSAHFMGSSTTPSPISSVHGIASFLDNDSDAWADVLSHPYSGPSSGSSSYSDLSELIIDPPTNNGWSDTRGSLGLGFSSQFGASNSEVDPQENMFY